MKKDNAEIKEPLETAEVTEQIEAAQGALESSLKDFELGLAGRNEMTIIINAYDRCLQNLSQKHHFDLQTQKEINAFHSIVKNKEYVEANDNELKNFTANILNTYENLRNSICQDEINSKVKQMEEYLSQPLENKTNLTKVSESALKRMQQKIDAVAQKGFKKDNNKDKGVER
ncbi:hypothetical protein [Helicobacter cinaedi]|uniref:hypothetical protein n=1 Tax=Helicobacter cinaedi TaxID=213 RepID=UPI000D7C1FC8|nr:hypothetical protein [Helicobacter cinaedi]